MKEMEYIPYSHQLIDEDDINTVVAVLRSKWLTQGPQVIAFEEALCKYTGARYAVAVSSGTAALHIACLAAGIAPRDEVITSPITFVASANCVLYCGGKPVFADVQQDTININPEAIKKKINKKTKAIIPVHFAGHPCDLKEIRRITGKHNVIVIEDAAHALGAEYKGSKIGSCTYSDMTVFSFHPVKSITTGEGGAILTNSSELYRSLSTLRTHGITKEYQENKRDGEWYYEMRTLGFNYRITDIQAALGVSQLRKLDSFVVRRRKLAKFYERSFRDNPYFDVPIEREYVRSAYHLYPIRLKNRFMKGKKAIFHKMRDKGIGVQVHYIPVYLQPYYEQFGFKKGLCPNAEDFYTRAMSIPLYPALKKRHMQYVVKSILEICAELGR